MKLQKNKNKEWFWLNVMREDNLIVKAKKVFISDFIHTVKHEGFTFILHFNETTRYYTYTELKTGMSAVRGNTVVKTIDGFKKFKESKTKKDIILAIAKVKKEMKGVEIK